MRRSINARQIADEEFDGLVEPIIKEDRALLERLAKV